MAPKKRAIKDPQDDLISPEHAWDQLGILMSLLMDYQNSTPPLAKRFPEAKSLGEIRTSLLDGEKITPPNMKFIEQFTKTFEAIEKLNKEAIELQAKLAYLFMLEEFSALYTRVRGGPIERKDYKEEVSYLWLECFNLTISTKTLKYLTPRADTITRRGGPIDCARERLAKALEVGKKAKYEWKKLKHGPEIKRIWRKDNSLSEISTDLLVELVSRYSRQFPALTKSFIKDVRQKQVILHGFGAFPSIRKTSLKKRKQTKMKRTKT